MRDKVKRFISILMTALMLVNLMPVGRWRMELPAAGISRRRLRPRRMALGFMSMRNLPEQCPVQPRMRTDGIRWERNG